MKTIIAGSRTITDQWAVNKAIIGAVAEWQCLISEVVCGGARGVDDCGRFYAKANDIPVKMFPADWDTHGKAAGHIRNAQMADYADCLILIWDGESRGSKNMLENAKKKGLLIYETIIKPHVHHNLVR